MTRISVFAVYLRLLQSGSPPSCLYILFWSLCCGVGFRLKSRVVGWTREHEHLRGESVCMSTRYTSGMLKADCAPHRHFFVTTFYRWQPGGHSPLQQRKTRARVSADGKCVLFYVSLSGGMCIVTTQKRYSTTTWGYMVTLSSLHSDGYPTEPGGTTEPSGCSFWSEGNFIVALRKNGTSVTSDLFPKVIIGVQTPQMVLYIWNYKLVTNALI